MLELGGCSGVMTNLAQPLGSEGTLHDQVVQPSRAATPPVGGHPEALHRHAGAALGQLLGMLRERCSRHRACKPARKIKHSNVHVIVLFSRSFQR